MAQITPEEFVHWFKESMQYQLGVQYSPDWKKDVDRARDLLLDFGEDTLRRMARTLIEDPDEFSKSKTGVSIQRLYARRNHLAQSMRTPSASVDSHNKDFTPEQVKWRIKYAERVLESPSLQVEYCPVREEWLKLHAYYSSLLGPAERRVSAQRREWGQAPDQPGNVDPSEALAEQLKSPS